MRRASAVVLRLRAVVLLIGFTLLITIGVSIAEGKRPQGASAADGSPLELEVQPSELALDAGQPAHGRLLVLAKNSKRSTIASASLSFIPVTGLTAKIIQNPPLPSAGDLFWILEVTGGETAPVPAKLVIQLTYATAGATNTPIVTATTTTISAPSPASVTALKAAVAPPDGSVEEKTPLDVVLEIDNPTRQTAHIKNIALLAPANYVEFDPKQPPPSMSEIPPGGRLATPLHITTKKEGVVPGTYTLVIGFNAGFSNQSPQWAPATAQAKINVEVRGVSDALQFLNVGSLLLLPGALIILTFIASFSWYSGRAPVDWKNPFLLVVSVILSFVAAEIYPVVTQWRGDRHDYLKAYQLQDVINVWVGSVAVGGGGGMIAGALLKFIQWWKASPDPADKPIDVLCKLKRHGADFWLTAVQRDPNGDDAAAQLMLVLPFGGAAAGRRWLIQRVRLQQGDANGAAARYQTIVSLLNGDRGAAVHTKKLVEVVQEGFNARQVLLSWERSPDVGPVEAADAEYPHVVGPRTIILPL
ncbi:hypothetical protein B1812_17780 [Methylocystis bryophila]|uniref:Uncharacterized protein n=1 Tax=Methylocystis bryophila TaxID=655015 RepID=A0A1W6MYH6_9HYPH|nr:hypothetical protein B1812_17780 [Methylocystis bryophila]